MAVQETAPRVISRSRLGVSANGMASGRRPSTLMMSAPVSAGGVAVGDCVGVAVGACVGVAVGACVGVAVAVGGGAVRVADGAAVSDGVSVGASVGSATAALQPKTSHATSNSGPATVSARFQVIIE